VYTVVWWRKVRESSHSEDVGIDWRIILNGPSRNRLRRHGMDGSSSGLGQVAGSCERVEELSGSIKCREFLD
jgi:hypothetical protein